MDNTERKFTEMVKEYRKTIYTVCYFFSNDKHSERSIFSRFSAKIATSEQNIKKQLNVCLFLCILGKKMRLFCR